MNTNPKIFTLLFCLTLLSACSINSRAPSKNNPNLTPTKSANSTSSTTPVKNTAPQDTDVAINTKYGQIVIKLYTKESPNTTANFLKKAKSGFYKNLTFHRVEPGFVIQGGDPLGNGTGGGTIKSEINTIPFVRGSVGLARGTVKEVSNDSQFFICLTTENCSQLTNQYVNFGEVVSGMDAVDQIAIGDKILDITGSTK